MFVPLVGLCLDITGLGKKAAFPFSGGWILIRNGALIDLLAA